MQVLKATQKRIVELDVIRGFAVLGILLMNIQSFSMPGETYTNPAAYGDLTGLNLFAWAFSHLFADQKFMSIFSMLFGASIVMITQNAAKKGSSEARVHYSRNFWLLIIGLVHAYLIWYGDILTMYAFCAFLLFPVRKWKIRTLAVVGLLLFSVPIIINLVMGFSLPHLPKEVSNEIASGWTLTQEQLNDRLAAYQGSYVEQLNARITTALMMQTQYFFFFFFWRITGLMLLGMALFKSGFFSGEKAEKSYKRILLFAGLLGFILVSIGIVKNFAHNWQFEYAMFLGSIFNYVGSLGIAMAYVAGLVLIVKYNKLPKLTRSLAKVGKMALSNYLLQSIICTFIFYGLGFFGEVSRILQLLLVFAVWLMLVAFSNFWIQKFKYGVFEWLWRSLTKMRLVQLK